jgi:hypothetical protein
MTISKALPFPRGETYSQGRTALLDANFGSHLIGKLFYSADTEHSTNEGVVLRVVKLEAAVTIPGTAAAPLHKLYAFGTTAKDFGRTLTGALAAAGVICKPLDDAYAGAQVLPQYDLAYVIDEGPCNITTGATAVSLAQHAAVSSDAVGCVAADATTSGQYVVGVIDEASTAESTEVLVHVVGGLTPSDAGDGIGSS